MLLCSDITTMRAFYAEVLGLQVQHEIPERYVELRAGAATLALRLRSRPYDGPARETAGASVQLAFRVPPADVDAAAEQLVERGIGLLEPVTTGTGSSSVRTPSPILRRPRTQHHRDLRRGLTSRIEPQQPLVTADRVSTVADHPAVTPPRAARPQKALSPSVIASRAGSRCPRLSGITPTCVPGIAGQEFAGYRALVPSGR
jgi:glyoxylase I family protein